VAKLNWKTLPRTMYEALIHSKLSLINYISMLNKIISHNIATAAWSQYGPDILNVMKGLLQRSLLKAESGWKELKCPHKTISR
jgi:hypothetical protein